MNAWFTPRSARAARAVLILSAALVVAGLVPLLYFVGLLGWQIVTLFQTRSWVALPVSLLFTEHSFAFIPQLAWPWLASPDSLLPAHAAIMWVLSKVHVGLLFGLAGLALAAVGVVGVLRQRALIRLQRQELDDRKRRVRDYRNDHSAPPTLDERLEPFISVPKKARAAGGGGHWT
jgi:hypothetical protein